MSGTYYKLAVFDVRSFCFRDGKVGYPDESAARAAAKAAGQYRISTVTDAGRVDGEPFTVSGGAAPKAPASRKAGGLKDRPGPWFRS